MDNRKMSQENDLEKFKGSNQYKYLVYDDKSNKKMEFVSKFGQNIISQQKDPTTM